MEDKNIICKDCGKEFVFTTGEQEFFKEKGFTNDPVRCPDCRKIRKNQKRNNFVLQPFYYSILFFMFFLYIFNKLICNLTVIFVNFIIVKYKVKN